MSGSRAALLVGAGDAIGAAVARRFAIEGYKVCIARRDASKAQPLVNEMAAAGRDVRAYSVDARKEAQVQDLCEQVERDAGPIEICLFNAGANGQKPLLETTGELFFKAWELACYAGFLVGREATRCMLRHGRGTMLFTGATASLRGGKGFAAFAAAKRFLSYLPSNARAPLPTRREGAEPNRIGDAILDLVPTSARKVYDVRKVLAKIADAGSVFELKPTFASNLVTAFARLGGRPVGFIANQPQRLGGMLNADACDKGAHFLALCDAYGLPLVSFIDVPGFSIGSGAERTNLGRRSAKLIFEWGHLSVPRVSVVLRKGYGLGYFAMSGGRSFAADACFAWPTAEICAMSIEGAIDVAFRKEYERAPDPQTRRQEMIDETRARIGALRAAEGFGVDDVIDPRDTRRRLIEIFTQTQARRPNDHPPKHRSIVPI